MRKSTLMLLFCFLYFCAYGQEQSSIDTLIKKYAKENKVDEKVIHAIVKIESNYNPKAVGADTVKDTDLTDINGYSYGLMQIKYGTAKVVGFTGKLKELFRPEINLKYGIKYLAYCLEMFKGNLNQALDAYNRGPLNVQLHPYKGKWENHRYVGKVLAVLSTL